MIKNQQRAGSERSRNGCLTCKIRRVKCDETKPRCQKCADTGRKCEGPLHRRYLFVQHTEPHTSSKVALSRLQGVPQQNLSQERRAFVFYIKIAAPILSGVHGAQFWRSLVPQLCHAEATVWNAVLAISLLWERAQSKSFISEDEASPPSVEPLQRQALLWYTKAITNFRVSSEGRSPDACAALLSCTLFSSIEFQQENAFTALSLWRKGVSIFSDLLDPDLDVLWSQSSGMSDVVIPFFSGHAIFMATYGQPWPSIESRYIKNRGFIVSPLPMISTIEQAEDVLHLLLYHCYDILRRAMLHHQTQKTTFILESLRKNFVSKLEQWDTAFQDLACADQDLESSLTASRLVMYRAVAFTSISTCVDSQETSFDGYISHFDLIVQHAEMMLSCPSTRSAEHNLKLVPPLFFTTTKCRHKVTRKKSLELLRQILSFPMRHLYPEQTIWTAIPTVRIAEKMIELEETPVHTNTHNLTPRDSVSYSSDNKIVLVNTTDENITSPSLSLLPPETSRIHYVQILLHQSQTTNHNGGRGKKRIAIKTFKLLPRSAGKAREVEENIVDL